MEGGRPEYPRKLFAFLVLGAVGLALIAVGITGHTGWALIVPGFVAVMVSLSAVWVIQASQLKAASRTKKGR
jgi:hypothetical protein